MNLINSIRYCIVYVHTDLEGKKSGERFVKTSDGEALYCLKKEYLIDEVERNLKNHLSMEDMDLREYQKMDEVVKTCEEWGPNTVTELEYVNYSHIGCGKFWTFY